ncbi:mycofactocin-coupled SDR family oxidoreductase [Branchiibius sp. NY16-3462-2]|uniref:mycofactocin-coupled SDR family oxidoreductase n=1 Tax=Branchiibius sp. NY16-3462-2 TaxID=1807500 RepID=UPI000A99B61C|nr:mycofactocin-coupled SDR family oxidoreductase [Branchiibius sp. NY16-3462-2]
MTTAVVTGAARGLGAAVTRRLVDRGLHVVAVDAAEHVVAPVDYPRASPADLMALQQVSQDVSIAQIDAAQQGELHDIVERAVGQHGPLVAVVAAAATIEGGQPLWETDPEVLERLWHNDVRTVWATAAVTVPHLLAAAQEGHDAAFVAIASAAAHRGLWHLSAYCTVKHAVLGLVRGLAADLKGTGVTAVAVSPGSMDTRMLAETARIYGLPDTSPLAEAQTTGAALTPEEVAALVETACFSGPALHGSVLHADGGFTL